MIHPSHHRHDWGGGELVQGAPLMKRLLVVEDDVTLRQSLQRGLILEGYVVFTAGTGSEGYQLAIQ